MNVALCVPWLMIHRLIVILFRQRVFIYYVCINVIAMLLQAIIQVDVHYLHLKFPDLFVCFIYSRKKGVISPSFIDHNDSSWIQEKYKKLHESYKKNMKTGMLIFYWRRIKLILVNRCFPFCTIPLLSFLNLDIVFLKDTVTVEERVNRFWATVWGDQHSRRLPFLIYWLVWRLLLFWTS